MLSQIGLALGGAFLTACGAYILMGPVGSTKKRSKDKVRGLENLGNTCFLNSLLQAWAACPSVYGWLHASVSQAPRPHAMLATTLLSILQVLNNEVEEDVADPYNPGRLLGELRARHWVITAEEQDAHELLHVLTETLDEETTRYPSVLSLFDVSHLEAPEAHHQPPSCAHTRTSAALPVLPTRHTAQPSRGLLASQLTCLRCGSRCPVKYDIFDSLSLAIPHNYWGPISLDGLLRAFISPEIVKDVDCDSCTRGAGASSPCKSNFRKTVSFGKLPQVLCIHLQRTQWLNNGAPVKRHDHVSFPDMLQMDTYLYHSRPRAHGDHRLRGGAELTLSILSQSPCAPRVGSSGPVNLLRALNYDQQLTQTGLFVQQPHHSPQLPEEMSDINHNAPPEAFKPPSALTYKLSSVVNHLGDLDSGHFVTYRRGLHRGTGALKGAAGLGSRWWLASDAAVARVSSDQVMGSEAYMLFYERW